MDKPLQHLKVLELASVLAGPAVGMFFAELGADVTKVENKRTGGDVTRSWKLGKEDRDGFSAYFASVNWNKNHIFVDFKDKKDLDQVKSLAAEADLIISNFKTGDGEKYGLDYSSLHKLNPKAIIGEIQGFGDGDSRVAYDLILQAESGFMSMNGTPDSGPVKMPVALIDLLAAHQLKEGLLLCLLKGDAYKGSRVTVSLYDAAVSSLANQATNWLMNGHIPQRMGSTHPNIAPYGEIFKTSDGASITFAIGSNRQFEDLCETLGVVELAQSPEFNTNQNRIKNRNRLANALDDAVVRFKSDDLISQLQKKSVPVARIKNLREVFEDKDAQDLLLEDQIKSETARRVQTAVFRITTP